MKNILVVLSSDPLKSDLYEQGIEVTLNLADAEVSVEAYFEGEFLKALKEASNDSIFYKKLKQINLYEVKCSSNDKALFLAEDFEQFIAHKADEEANYDNIYAKTYNIYYIGNFKWVRYIVKLNDKEQLEITYNIRAK